MLWEEVQSCPPKRQYSFEWFQSAYFKNENRELTPQVRKEGPAPPKAKAKALKAKRAVLKGVHSHKEKTRTHPPSEGPRHQLRRQPTYRRKTPPAGTRLINVPSASSPKDRVSQDKTEDNNTRVFNVDIKANKHQIKQPGKKLHDLDLAKVNIPEQA